MQRQYSNILKTLRVSQEPQLLPNATVTLQGHAIVMGDTEGYAIEWPVADNFGLCKQSNNPDTMR